MVSRDGRWVLAYNGEIYNFTEVRRELEATGVLFRGRSDTEVLLEAVARWGVMAALQRVAGMFAIVLWDRERREMHLARDRFGEKPLYYGWMGRTFVFGSELKALRAHPAFRAEVDRNAVALFLRFNYIPAPHSIFKGVLKLLPAHVATVRADGSSHVVAYWSLEEVAERGMAAPIEGSDDELVAAFRERLQESVTAQMVADVPLGALLSGGIDSSAVVAFMQSGSARPIRTFTIGFDEEGYNEAAHARAVAAHLGTEHTEHRVTPAEARAVIPLLPTIYDEPFGDSSQIPTLLVAQLARRHVTVALSGDGGDELLGGYNRYALGQRIWSNLAPWPRPLRRAAAKAVWRVAPSQWQAVLGVAQRLLPNRLRVAHVGDRMHKLAGVFDASSPQAMYRELVSHWPDPSRVVLGGAEPPGRINGHALPGASMVEQMMYTDAMTYLPDDIMVKVDRASMAASLETRAPFLDHRLAEFAWRLPMSVKCRGREGKWVLRQVLYELVPRALVERPKMGFGVPIDSWLRGPLREWATDLLAPDRIRREGILQPDIIADTLVEHLSGERNWQYRLWDVLMFEAWLESESALTNPSSARAPAAA